MSLLLDTNVVSELIREVPHSAVVDWQAIQPLESLFISTISEAEMRIGAEILPAGRRRQTLTIAIEMFIWDAFQNRVRPFDRQAAREYAEIVATRKRLGRQISPFDGQIAAIARSQGMAIVTRNEKDFEAVGIKIINPWLEV